MTATEEIRETKTIGRAIIESKDFASRMDGLLVGEPLRLQLERKDITGLSAQFPAPLAAAGGGWSNPLAVRGRLVPVGRTTAGAVIFPVEDPLNPADPADILTGATPEGQLKPEYDADAWETDLEVIKTFAVTLKISRETLNDLPFLADRINQRMQAALARKIDEEIIVGIDTATHLNGLWNLANLMTGTGSSSANAIGMAYAELAARGFAPDGIVFNVADLGAFMTSGTLGLGVDTNLQSSPVWGMRVGAIVSTFMAGSFLIGAFAGNCMLVEREEINVQVAYENVNDFIKNMATVKIETRCALACFAPNAFLKGALTP